MPAAMTYTSLLEDIRLYAERSDADFLAQRDRFVMMAENRLAKEVRGLGNLQIVASTLTSGSPLLAKPERWRETASFIVTLASGEKKALFLRDINYCREFWPNISLEDEPRFYADYGFEHFYLAPTPNAALNFELAYFDRPEPLSDTNETNWYTQYAPDLLLFACLVEAQPFLKQDARTEQFRSMYERSLQMLANEAMRRMSDNSQVRREG